MEEKKEWLVSVRMLSVISRFETDVPFSQFIKMHDSLAVSDTERQIHVGEGYLSYSSREDTFHLMFPGKEADETHVTWCDGESCVTVLRKGPIEGEMRFCKEEDCPFGYETPFGSLKGTIHTLDIFNSICDGRGALSIRYLTDIGGSLQRTIIKFTVE